MSCDSDIYVMHCFAFSFFSILTISYFAWNFGFWKEKTHSHKLIIASTLE